MTAETFESRHSQLQAEIASLPADVQSRLEYEASESLALHSFVKQECTKIAETVSDWRLACTYLTFDCEAAIREIQQLGRDLRGEKPSF